MGRTRMRRLLELAYGGYAALAMGVVALASPWPRH
jgi:hypothetical protein